MSRPAKPRPPTTLGMWTVEHGDAFTAFADRREVSNHLQKLTRAHPSGRVYLDEDVGQRSWLKRFLSGLSEREVQMHLALEWSGQTASLVFFDEAVSEHWAISDRRPANLDEATRLAIAHGEDSPIAPERCLPLETALQAIDEYLPSKVRPSSLRYEVVD